MIVNSETGEFEYLLVGGGLQNALIALALLEANPSASVCLVESGNRLGGNHSWCFHPLDLPPEIKRLVVPMLRQRWTGYSVRFPELCRELDSAYALVTSERLHEHVSKKLRGAPRAKLLTSHFVESMQGRVVQTQSGQRIAGRVVIDSRGPVAELGDERRDDHRNKHRAVHSPRDLAYQKFVGLEFELTAPSPVERPILMDAQVEQIDGFRFVYTLPLSTRRVLIEDTYYSLSPQLDYAVIESRIRQYAASNGFKLGPIVRSEDGVLPLPIRHRAAPPVELRSSPALRSSQALGSSQAQPSNSSDSEAPGVASPPEQSLYILGGYAGGWLHPTTGYSFPAAGKLAMLLLEHEQRRQSSGSVSEDPTSEALSGLAQAIDQLRQQLEPQWQFATRLNRLLFEAFPPAKSYGALEHFYRLPQDTVERFYALKMTSSDRRRVFLGRPPRGFSAIRWAKSVLGLSQQPRTSLSNVASADDTPKTLAQPSTATGLAATQTEPATSAQPAPDAANSGAVA